MTGTPSSVLYSHNHHQLAVSDCHSPLDVLSFEGHEALSEPFSWYITFTSTDLELNRHAMLRKAAALSMKTATVQPAWLPAAGPLRVVQGVITGFDALSVSADQACYGIRLQPRLALLARNRQNAIWQDMSVPQILEAILRERHGMRGQDFLFALTRDYPQREQVMQYHEDDLRFVSRLLAEVGIWFRFTTDSRLNIDVVEFCDGPQGYASGITIPAVPPSGMHDKETESIWALQSRFRVVEKSVSTGDYNYRDAKAYMNAMADVTAGDETTYGEAWHWADNYLQAGVVQSAAPATESGAFYARLRHERYLNGQTQLSALTSAASLMPGMVVCVTGGSDVAEDFRQGVVVTRLISRAARDRSLETELHGIPAQGRYSYRPEPAPRPAMAGTLPARVTSTTVNDTYGHIDKYGRYRVKMLFDRVEWDTGFESLWVRQARPFAGDTYGLHLPLLAGTEVAIGFEHGNPDRPYIAGVLHDSAHPDHVTIRNFRRNVLRTPANNKLRLDDTRGQEHIKLSTEYGGKSQLNLGHLVDGERQVRGEGFELRTDSWGAIRAQKGLFISADGQPGAQGQQKEMQAALVNLGSARQQMDELSGDAAQALANPADLQAQVSLLERQLQELKESVLLMSAPDGIALASGEHLQMSAAQNLVATAGKNADIGVMKNLFIGVGNALSVFVRKLGIKLIANQGPVEMQAQNDLMMLLARKELSIISTEDEIRIVAKKKITLNGGGSYITLDGNSLEFATLGEFRSKAGQYSRQLEANKDENFPVVEPEIKSPSKHFFLS